MSRFLDEVKRLIQINSVSASGNEELVNFIGFLMQNAGFKVNLQQVMLNWRSTRSR